MDRLIDSGVLRRTLLFVVLFLGGAAFLSAQQGQELVFRNDGQLSKDGKASVTVPVQEGQQLTFRIASLDFSPSVNILVNGESVAFEADDGQTATKAIRVRKGTSAVIQISAVDAGTGSFQVRVFKQKENAPLTLNGIVKGTITAADTKNDYDELIDYYPMAVKKGQRILVGLSSTDGDAHLRIELPDGTSLENDDSAGSDSRIIADVKENGTWLVGATMLLYDEDKQEGFSFRYNLYAREIPQPKTLNIGATGLNASYAAVGSDIPPIPDTYSVTIAKAGIYKVKVSGAKDLSPGIQIKASNGQEFTRRPGDGGDASAELRYYFRAGTKLDLTTDALATTGKTSYSISIVADGDPVTLKDGAELHESLNGAGEFFYIYKGKAGEYIEFLMGSEDFDTSVRAIDDPGQELHWDDYYESDYSYASLGRYYFEKAGDLLIIAGTADGSTEGDFDFNMNSSASGKLVSPKDYQQKTVLVSDKPLFTRLTAADQNIDGEITDEYILDLKTNDVFSISAKSIDFDARLTVLSPDGNELVSNDDFEGNLDPQVEAIAPRTGKYIVRLQTYQPDHPATLNRLYDISYTKLGTVAAVGKPVDGHLGEESDTTDDGEPYDSTQQRVRAGQKLYIVASSDDFDPRLELYDANGKLLADNADYGNGTSARITYQVAKAGNFEIRVIDSSAEEGIYEGSYTLTVYELK